MEENSQRLKKVKLRKAQPSLQSSNRKASESRICRKRAGAADADARGSARRAAVPALPCLNRNNSIQTNRKTEREWPSEDRFLERVNGVRAGVEVCKKMNSDGSFIGVQKDKEGREYYSFYDTNGERQGGRWIQPMTGYQRKQVFYAAENTAALIEQAGIDNVGFLTVTFADNPDPHEAQARINSFLSNGGRDHLGKEYLRVAEFQNRGTIHYHFLIKTPEDIRTGFDWETFHAANDAYSRGDKRKGRELTKKYAASAPEWLKSMWGYLRRCQKAYGLGRCELIPIRSSSECMGKYIGKYLQKDVATKPPSAKGVRLFQCSRGFNRRVSMAFSFLTEASCRFRSRVGRLAAHLGVTEQEGVSSKLGPKWAYQLRQYLIPKIPNAVQNMLAMELGGWPKDRRIEYEETCFSTLLSYAPGLIQRMCFSTVRIGGD